MMEMLALPRVYVNTFDTPIKEKPALRYTVEIHTHFIELWYDECSNYKRYIYVYARKPFINTEQSPFCRKLRITYTPPPVGYGI